MSEVKMFRDFLFYANGESRTHNQSQVRNDKIICNDDFLF